MRQYPRGLGNALVKLFEEKRPVPDLRSLADLDPSQSALELFQSQEMGDPWMDADLPAVFMYLYSNRHLKVPPLWKSTMAQFAEELSQVSWLYDMLQAESPLTSFNFLPSLQSLLYSVARPRFHVLRAQRGILVSEG